MSNSEAGQLNTALQRLGSSERVDVLRRFLTCNDLFSQRGITNATHEEVNTQKARPPQIHGHGGDQRTTI